MSVYDSCYFGYLDVQQEISLMEYMFSDETFCTQSQIMVEKVPEFSAESLCLHQPGMVASDRWCHITLLDHVTLEYMLCRMFLSKFNTVDAFYKHTSWLNKLTCG